MSSEESELISAMPYEHENLTSSLSVLIDIVPSVKVKQYHLKCLVCNERILNKNEFGLCFYCKLDKRIKHYN